MNYFLFYVEEQDLATSDELQATSLHAHWTNGTRITRMGRMNTEFSLFRQKDKRTKGI